MLFYACMRLRLLICECNECINIYTLLTRVRAYVSVSILDLQVYG